VSVVSSATVSITPRRSSASPHSAPINPHHVRDTAARFEVTEGREDTENSNVGADRGTENSNFLAARTPCIACSSHGQADEDFFLRKQPDEECQCDKRYPWSSIGGRTSQSNTGRSDSGYHIGFCKQLQYHLLHKEAAGCAKSSFRLVGIIQKSLHGCNTLRSACGSVQDTQWHAKCHAQK